MIRDLRRIYCLVSDLIFLCHPVILNIRYQFHCTVCEILLRGPGPDKSQEEWNAKNVGFNNWTLSKFIKAFKKDRMFREHIIEFLEFEKVKLLRDPPFDLEELKDYEAREKKRKGFRVNLLVLFFWSIIGAALTSIIRAIFSD